jgi:Undecaprenyl-phosphate glucose phosphotransferase
MSSSPPIADLGSGAAAVRARRPRLDEREAEAVARRPLRRSDGETAPGSASVETLPASNIIELDPPQLRRAGVREPVRPTPARINPHGVAFAVLLADAVVAAATGAFAYRLQPGFHWPPDPATAFTALAVVAMLARVPNSEPRLLHDTLRRALSRRLADAALRTLLPFLLSILVVMTLLPAADATRAPLLHWLTLWAMAATAGICGIRLCLAAGVAHWRSRGRLRQAVAIFGTGDLAELLLARLKATSPDAVEVIGVFDDRDRSRITNPGLRSLALGNSDDLVALSRHRDIDRVLVALPHSAERRVVEVLKKLRLMPVEISLAPDLVAYNLPCRETDAFGCLPLLEIYGKRLSFGQALLKSAVDKVLAVLATIVGAPLLMVIAVAIKLDSKGPILFRQNRYGFGDRMIGVYKFRTMRANAADHNGETQAERNDPRITRVGRCLRRWSLDELPQLINVLRGEMSLVGPRPHAVDMRVEEQRNHDIVPDYALRHHMKPGITGWAQVNGYHGPVTSTEALHARVRYDLEYINNWSLWFDLRVLLRTIRIVLGQRHSY